ncbi:hypothetical protein I4U23_009630 [Adineta vaga]|nr:hypothetical protein I4U23_009630 [Adineta vaga]
MGNSSGSTHLSNDLINTRLPVTDDIFKVDNINSCGRKHAVAKLQVSNNNLCIRQKHRQSLYIPLETIKRYGLDGSIFILECGRRAPLGQARYAFRCKQARRLVDCLDQRISLRSKQLLEQQRRSTILPSSPLTNASPNSNPRRRRTQSDHGISRRAPSSILFSTSSSTSVSFNSRATFSCRNSVPNLSENYLPFNTLPCDDHDDDEEEAQQQQQERLFSAKLKQPLDKTLDQELNYVEFKPESFKFSIDEEDLSPVLNVPIIRPEDVDLESTKQSPTQQPRKRSLLSVFNNHQQKSNKTVTVNQINSSAISSMKSESSSTTTTTPYVYIDHEKTVTLTDIANKRLQHQQQVRRVEI